VQAKPLFSPYLILALLDNLLNNGLTQVEVIYWKDTIVIPKDGLLLSNSMLFIPELNFGTGHLNRNLTSNISPKDHRWLTDISLDKL
jgi:hypothetical protein